MNEELLQLCPWTVRDYMDGLLKEYSERKKEMDILITNMPQKHSLANIIAVELENIYGDESVLKDEIDILKRSTTDYILFTNAILYLERRWNTKTIENLLQQALPKKEYSLIHPLVIDTTEEKVEGECIENIPSITLPNDTNMILTISVTLHKLHSKNIITSIRDTFTAYKIILAYSSHVNFSIEELLALAKYESIDHKNILGSILLGIIVDKAQTVHYSNLLVALFKRSKNLMAPALHLLLDIYNTAPEIWHEIEDIAPHLYICNKYNRDYFYSLLFTLSTKNTLFLYEMLDGEVPNISKFDPCKEARATIPSPVIRSAAQELLNIPNTQTYTTTEPIHPQEGLFVFNKTVQYNEIESIDKFFSFFIALTKHSHTHFNNHLREYLHIFQSLLPTELNRFISMLLTAPNSIVYKELCTHRLFSLLT
ncbi:hypothetical protein NEOKW01_1264 [Nematocida sp. AWRm80]|nr:hypothetical protein NEOKW01_1264 [Nematocida sp. AWRm80]